MIRVYLYQSSTIIRAQVDSESGIVKYNGSDILGVAKTSALQGEKIEVVLP